MKGFSRLARILANATFASREERREKRIENNKIYLCSACIKGGFVGSEEDFVVAARDVCARLVPFHVSGARLLQNLFSLKSPL